MTKIKWTEETVRHVAREMGKGIRLGRIAKDMGLSSATVGNQFKKFAGIPALYAYAQIDRLGVDGFMAEYYIDPVKAPRKPRQKKLPVTDEILERIEALEMQVTRLMNDADDARRGTIQAQAARPFKLF